MVNAVCAVLSPQLTSTRQEFAFGVESLKDPRVKETKVPSVANWSPGLLTSTGLEETLTWPWAKVGGAPSCAMVTLIGKVPLPE